MSPRPWTTCSSSGAHLPASLTMAASACRTMPPSAWLFCGSDRGGERAAVMYSLIVTALCRARHRQVYAARRTMPSRVLFPRFLAERRLLGSALLVLRLRFQQRCTGG